MRSMHFTGYIDLSKCCLTIADNDRFAGPTIDKPWCDMAVQKLRCALLGACPRPMNDYRTELINGFPLPQILHKHPHP